MWRIPILAEGIFTICALFLCYAFASANLTVDSDVEEGQAMEMKTFLGRKRQEMAKQSEKNHEWWHHNYSCRNHYLNLTGCFETRPQKCFDVAITYNHRVEIDEHFPHWIELLRHFPRCWRRIAPFVCLVHFRPCEFLEHYIVVELFKPKFCNDMRSFCDFGLRHFPPTAPSYLSCDARVKSPNYRNDSPVPVFNADCKLNFYNPTRNETVQLEGQAKSCLAPLVYVNTTDKTQQTHALPFVDECYIPCSSTIYEAESLSVLKTFTFLAFLLVLVFALLLLSRAKLIFGFGIFICLLAIVSTFLIALTFAVSPFLGDGIICLLDGRIRRFSGAFAMANGNDILCMMEAAFLKVCLVFVFWTSFISVCNRFLATKSFLFLQQFSAFCHILVSLFVTLWHREISIDPVSKVCHYFRFRSLFLSIADFISLLLVAVFILFLSNAKINFKKNNKKRFQCDQVLINNAPNESSILSGGKCKSGTEHCANETIVQSAHNQQKQLPFLQKLIDGLAQQISPLFLLFAYFGCIFSFYPWTENAEIDSLSTQINCSLSAISTDRWKRSEHLGECLPVPRIPHWYYANSLAIIFNLVLTLAVLSGSLSNLLKRNNGGDVATNDGDETEEDDNKIELDIFENGERAPTERNQLTDEHRANDSSNYITSVTDSICSRYATIDDSLASTHSALNNELKTSKRRKLTNLQGTRGRNRAQMGRGQLTTIGQHEDERNDGRMRANVTTPSSCSESASALYNLRYNQQIPGPSVNNVTGSEFLNASPHQPPMATTATEPAAPMIIVHHCWHPFYPTDGFNCSQNYNQQQHETIECSAGKVDGINEAEKNAGKNSCEGQHGADEKGETNEESDYPVSDHDTADSNDFCSDNSDPAEEQLWNERCRKAVESLQSAHT